MLTMFQTHFNSSLNIPQSFNTVTPSDIFETLLRIGLGLGNAIMTNKYS